MVAGIGSNRDFKSRSIMIGWVVLSRSIHKGAESTRAHPLQLHQWAAGGHPAVQTHERLNSPQSGC